MRMQGSADWCHVLNPDAFAYPTICRLARAALVSRGWHQVSTRPELQREVKFNTESIQSGVVPAAHSLLLWAQRHGASVRKFYIDLEGLNEFDDAEEAELMSVLDSCLVLCSSGLEELSVNLFGSQYTLGGWVLNAPRLQQMTFCFMDTLHTWFSLSGMSSSMQRLDVSAPEWQLVELPSSLTCLSINSHEAEAMPSQVRRTEAHLSD
jgi:hypothetical protein